VSGFNNLRIGGRGFDPHRPYQNLIISNRFEGSFSRTTGLTTAWPKKYRFDCVLRLTVIVAQNVPIEAESCGRVCVAHLPLRYGHSGGL
jgi:hypothetical protein